MEPFGRFLDLAVGAAVIIALLMFLPNYRSYCYYMSWIKSMFKENVAGKVVIITGASSGIGEHLAYEYARRGACLALVARREDRLREIRDRALWLGSREVIYIQADVSKPQGCRRFINETLNHFGKLDHLVNNAGIGSVCMFEETGTENSEPVMDTNFWGSVYSTYYALPHLSHTRGKIVGITSCAAWLPVPRMSFYNASKAAILRFYETLRTEVGSSVGITIVTPGLTQSEMTQQGRLLSESGTLEYNQEKRDIEFSVAPMASAERVAKKIVDSACKGEKYLTEPGWMKALYYWVVFCPEILEWFNYWTLLTGSGVPEREALGRKAVDMTGLHKVLQPSGIRAPELKDE
uniref:Uncharacterized protein n=1 Tax=Kalanchoe fedtschenkoi TaxID=63787 RepID=A0A7N0UHZ6_KALFE